MADAGMHVPALESRGDITGLEWIWEGWLELDTCRSLGFGFSRIPWTAIHEYVTAEAFNDAEAYVFRRVVRALDGVYERAMRDAGDRESKDKRGRTPLKSR